MKLRLDHFRLLLEGAQQMIDYPSVADRQIGGCVRPTVASWVLSCRLAPHSRLSDRIFDFPKPVIPLGPPPRLKLGWNPEDRLLN